MKLVTGYCRETKILAAGEPLELPDPAMAASCLLWLLRDFQFATNGDKGRAIAMLLTMALASGCFLASGRVPLFMIEKDQKGAGAGFLVSVFAAINGVTPKTTTPDDPKAAREDISKFLLNGDRCINLDNIRGNILKKLPFLESLLTEPTFMCRAPYLQGAVDVTRCVFTCTSNGALLSSDLADRTIKINIRKQPTVYQFAKWPEGGLIDHAQKHRTHYLGCIFSLIKNWAETGRPTGTRSTGFRFSQWESACAWILETFFPDLSFIDEAHRRGQEEMADPNHEMLRAVLQKAIERGATQSLTATDFVRFAVETSHMLSDGEKERLAMGRILTKTFPTEGPHDFAEFRVTRVDAPDKNYEKMKKYRVERRSGA